jgi:xanthine dehydrogenase YagS FAD-binding subunit
MKKFNYVNATTIDEAVSALAEDNTAPIAGGTDMLTYLKAFVSPNSPETLVNLKTIPNLDYITEDSGTLKIGAMAKLTDIYEYIDVASPWAALGMAAHKVGTPQLRNMGTLGGNICQYVRCWYYRSEHNGFSCLRKDPSGLCYAQIGDNRYHSIFGGVDGCFAVNPSDTAPALVALNAKIVTTKQEVNAEDFFTVNGEKTTILDDDEIVTEIQIPAQASGTKSSFIKFAIRKAWDFPIVNCAVAITSSGGTASAARICLNAVHNMPYRATAAEDAINGQAINEANAEAAGSAAVANKVILPHNTYMVQIAKTLVKRGIMECA